MENATRRSWKGKCLTDDWQRARPAPLLPLAPGRKLNAAPLTKTRHAHSHTRTTGETLLLGRDETDPELKGVAVCSEERGDSGDVCRRWHQFKANAATSHRLPVRSLWHKAKRPARTRGADSVTLQRLCSRGDWCEGALLCAGWYFHR